jgi:hypothetical protein
MYVDTLKQAYNNIKLKAGYKISPPKRKYKYEALQQQNGK